MRGFELCADCRAEYGQIRDRRYHAEPIACAVCGPRVWLVDEAGNSVATEDPIAEAAQRLAGGEIVAVKGLGGFHLACSASDAAAVARLRERKGRPDKPLAVMARDLAVIASFAVVSDSEAAALEDWRRPIVLLDPRPDPFDGRPQEVAPGPPAGRIVPAVGGSARKIGVMLPYTPLHHLLLGGPCPVVLTSGNRTDEPIARDNDEAYRCDRRRRALLHDRPILNRADDSVVRLERGRVLPIRRSRGYAPEPLALAAPVRRPVLGCGAELKSTFCLARGPHAFLSHHIGDLENAETLRSFTEGVAHSGGCSTSSRPWSPTTCTRSTCRRSTRRSCSGVELVGVQHHHAHLASCLADNGETGPSVGLACDGLGYGTDGVLWGGEVMEVSLTGFRRLAHLEEVPLPGGTTAIRQPWRMAAAWLRAAGIDGADLAVARRNPGWATVGRLLDSRVGVPATTSVGRLFDAVAALVGVRDAVNYEGQAAMEAEQAAVDDSRPRPVRAGRSCGPSAGSSVLAAAARIAPGDRRSGGLSRAGYAARVEGGVLYGSDLVGGVVDDLRAGVDVPLIAARFTRGWPACSRAQRRTRAPPPASTPSRSPAACSRTSCSCACSSPGWRPPDSGCSPTPGSPRTTRA